MMGRRVPTMSEVKKIENLKKISRNKDLEGSDWVGWGVQVEIWCQGLRRGEDGDEGSAYEN